jgi:hypothetical protein
MAIQVSSFESKQMIPYPSFGGEWSLVGDFRKKLLSCPCPSGSQSTNAKFNCPFHWSGSACVSPYGQKMPLHGFDNRISYLNLACKSRNMAKI